MRKRYEMWQHIDTGFQIIIEADSEEEALNKANDYIDNMKDEKLIEKIKDNMKFSDLDIFRVTVK